jgi:holliday junction DNA helicase RuvA
MITKMTGILNRVLDEEVRLQVGPFEYQVLIPEFVRRQVQMKSGSEVAFHVLEYIEGSQNSSRWTPRRIGFQSESELEFFELFCTVDKIGVKKALKAMSRPIKEIADAIARQDVKWLTTMPGIGKQTAEQIIATLRNKVTRFAMAPARETADGSPGSAQAIDGSVFEDAYLALLALQMSPVEARSRLDRVAASGRPYKTAEEVLNVIFRKE